MAIKSGITLTCMSENSLIGPKKISLSAKGTFAPHETTSKPLFIIEFICSLVTNLEAAAGIKMLAPICHIFLFIELFEFY